MKSPLLALLILLAPAQDALERKVADLVAKLSDDAIDARDQAVKELAELGLPAIPLLQKAMGKLEGEARGRVEEAIKAIRAQDTLGQSLPPLRPVTLEHRNRPAREALEEIARQAGISCHFEGDIGKEAVSVSLKGATLLQAVDEICRAHGQIQPQNQQLEPGIGLPQAGSKAPRTLLFAASPFIPFPSAYVRHYRARVTSVALTKVNNFQANESSGSLQLELEWQLGVSPRSCLKFEITELKDDKGRSLLREHKEDEGSFRGTTLFQRAGWESSTQESVEFKYPEADATKISLLRGSFVLAYPKEVTTLVFEKPAESKGKSREIHGLKVTLDDYQVRGTEHSIKITASGKYAGPVDAARPAGEQDLVDSRMPFSYEDVEPVTESGEPLNASGMSGGSEDNSFTMTLTYHAEKPQTIKEIRIPCVLLHHLDEVKFELKEIALPR